MPPSATFAADFSAILKEVDRVDNAITNLSLKPRGVESAFDRMSRSYSGANIVQQAEITARAIEQIGGTSRLTQQELERAGTVAKEAAEKMRKLGVDVPPHIQKLVEAVTPLPEKVTLAGKAAQFATSTFGQMFGAFSAVNLVERAIGTVVNFGKEAFVAAGRTVDLAQKLGVSTDAIQKWEFAAKQTGATVEQFASSAFKLQVRLAGDSDSVAAAVKDLGLSLDELRRARPEDQFEQIVSTLGQIDDATTRNKLGVELFGKSFESIASTVAQGYKEISDAANITSKDQLVALDKAGDAWDAFVDRQSKSVQAFLGNLVLMTQGRDAFFKDATKDSVRDLLAGPAGSGIGSNPVEEVFRQSAIEANNLETATRRLGTANQGLADDLERSTKELDKLATTAKKTTTELLVASDRMNDLTFGAGKLLSDLPAAISSQGASLAVPLADVAATQLPKAIIDGLATLPGKIQSQGISRSLWKAMEPPANFFSGLSKGFQDIWQGMSGGKGLGGLFSNIGGGISQGIGQIISQGLAGGLTGLINAGIGLLGKGLGKLFGGLFGGEGKKANDMRDQLFATAGGFEALNEKAALAGVTLNKVLDAKKVKDVDAAWKDLQATLSDFEADQERLNTAIERYGFSLEELGPKLQQSRLHDQATELIEDWRVLVGAGIDIATVNEKMAATVNEYLQTALRVGAEVPAAMKPILEVMAQQGTLVDENGEAITDLEKAGIKFSESMTQGFDRVVKKLDELITRLQGAGTAIASLPDIDIEENVHRRVWDVPDDAAFVPMASGGRGRVTKPTLFLAGERGAEEYAFSGAGRGFTRDGGGMDWSRLAGDIQRAVQRGVTDALVVAPRAR